MNSKGEKEMYYIARRNMNKYIKFLDKYYRIVGFYYYDSFSKGFIIIDLNGNGASYNDVKKMA